MKIGMVSLMWDDADFAGPGCAVPALATALSEHGHEVSLMVRRSGVGEPDWTSDLPYGLELIDVGPASSVPAAAGTGLVGQFVEQLARRLRGQRLDLLHAHGWLAGLACQLLPASERRPTVQTFPELRLAATRDPHPTATASDASRLRAERAVAMHADHVILPSGTDQQALLRAGVPRWRTSVVPSGVIADEDLDGHGGPGRHASPARILAFAHPADVSDLARVCAKLPGTELVCCWRPDRDDADQGRARDQRPAEGRAEPSTIIWPTDQRERAELIRSAAVVVCLTPTAEVGPVHLEAMAVGVPVLAGHPEAVEAVVDGISGFHLAGRSPGAVAATIRSVLPGTARRQAVGAAAQDRVASRNGWVRIGAETARVYERMLATEPHPAANGRRR